MHNLLDVDTFTRDHIDRVMKKAQDMEQIQRTSDLEGITICNLFFEPSTRTIVSFEIAGKSLGGQVLNVSQNTSSVVKGESIVDTVKTLSAMGVNVFVIRHPSVGMPYFVAQHTKPHIINAGDGDHAHPTQALIDAYVLQRHLGDLKAKNIVIVGDVPHSRVAKSNIYILNTLGAIVTLVIPDYFFVPDFQSVSSAHSKQWENPYELPCVQYEPNLNRALTKADAVIVLRIQNERLSRKTTYSKKQYISNYQINEQRMQHAQPHTLILHPGPINQGVEITPEVAYGAQSCIEEQVSAGVAIRKSILTLIAREYIDKN